MSYDVIVIGGGPVGSYLAGRLAGMGRSVAVLEQRTTLQEPVCCTGIISQECVNSFNISEELIVRKVSGACIVSPSGRVVKIERKETQACIIDRTKFNVWMASNARQCGANYMFGALYESLNVRSDGVVAKILSQGNELEMEAEAVVIATGFGSGLTQQSGLGKVGDFVMGAQAEVQVNCLDDVEVYFGSEVAPGFFAWLVPMSSHKALAGLLSRRNSKLYLEKLLDLLAEKGKIASSVVNPRYRGISLKPPAKTYGDRLLVVGDAAGQVKPTTGGGIYFGLICAEIAVDTLNSAFETADFSVKRFVSYQHKWKKKLARELSICYWARRFYERLSDAQIEHAFDIIQDDGILAELIEDSNLTFDWHGEVVLKLIRNRVLTRLGLTKIPMFAGR